MSVVSSKAKPMKSVTKALSNQRTYLSEGTDVLNDRQLYKNVSRVEKKNSMSNLRNGAQIDLSINQSSFLKKVLKFYEISQNY